MSNLEVFIYAISKNMAVTICCHGKIGLIIFPSVLYMTCYCFQYFSCWCKIKISTSQTFAPTAVTVKGKDYWLLNKSQHSRSTSSMFLFCFLAIYRVQWFCQVLNFPFYKGVILVTHGYLL